MADPSATPQRDNEPQHESFGSTTRFHIAFTCFKLFAIVHSNSKPVEVLSLTVLELYIICEAIYFIALIQVTGPRSPTPLYQWLYIVFGTLSAELLLWTSLSLAMWLILNMCLLASVLASSGLLARGFDRFLDIIQLFQDMLSSGVQFDL